MKIYIAGKITGLEYEDAESAFIFAETVVEKAGHSALNPLKMVQQVEWALHFDADGHDDGTGSGVEIERPYNDQLLDALAIVLDEAEGLYMLSNWRDSKGARIEHAIASELGLPIFYQASELPEAA